MKEFFISAAMAIAPLVVAGLGWLAKKLADLINANVKNQWLAGALTRLDYAVVNAVKSVEQTVADEIKAANADGVITDEEAVKIKQAAINAAKAYLGTKGFDEILRVLGMTASEGETLVANRIEAAVHDMKIAKEAAKPDPQ